jgi:magnesium transporter
MRILIQKDGNLMPESTDLDAVRSALEDPEVLVWVDLYHDAPGKSRQVLSEVFNFHPLSIDDALEEIHVPKIDDWGDYLYLSLVAVRANQPLDDITKSIELDVFLGSNFIVTYHQESYPAVDVVWTRLLRNESHQQNSKFILYQIIDELANEYMKMVNRLDARVVEIEGVLIQKPDKELLEEVFSIKRSLLNLRRIVVPQSVVLNKLSLGDFEIVEQKERMYFRDVYDHLIRVHEVIEILREFVNSVLDIYLSVVNNQLNNTIKILTIITTLVMLFSFLNEFFGMNIFTHGAQISQWVSTISVALFLIVLAFLLVIILLRMRRRDWM